MNSKNNNSGNNNVPVYQSSFENLGALLPKDETGHVDPRYEPFAAEYVKDVQLLSDPQSRDLVLSKARDIGVDTTGLNKRMVELDNARAILINEAQQYYEDIDKLEQEGIVQMKKSSFLGLGGALASAAASLFALGKWDTKLPKKTTTVIGGIVGGIVTYLVAKAVNLKSVIARGQKYYGVKEELEEKKSHSDQQYNEVIADFAQTYGKALFAARKPEIDKMYEQNAPAQPNFAAQHTPAAKSHAAKAVASKVAANENEISH